jgi:hypothetical protein
MDRQEWLAQLQRAAAMSHAAWRLGIFAVQFLSRLAVAVFTSS